MNIGYMFSGQGAQFSGMGRDLAEASAAAKAVFDMADEVLGRSISKLCFEGTDADLTSCANCQPAIYTMSQACLAAFLERRPDIKPVACGGLSLGELSALSAAGVFSVADGLRLVARRGELMDAACRETHGGMAAVIAAEASMLEDVCKKYDVDIANLNCPGQTVISGEDTKLAQAVSELVAAGVRVVTLTVAGAYHSRLMAGAAAQFGEYLKDVPMATPQCMVVQNVVGGAVALPEELRANLQKQVCSSVKWELCVRGMMGACDMLLEFGPGNVLCGFMKRIDRSYSVAPVNSLAALDALCEKL